MCQRQASGSGSFIFEVQSLVGIMEKHYKMMIIIYNGYQNIMAWLFFGIALVLYELGDYGLIAHELTHYGHVPCPLLFLEKYMEYAVEYLVLHEQVLQELLLEEFVVKRK
eukprot:517258_1